MNTKDISLFWQQIIKEYITKNPDDLFSNEILLPTKVINVLNDECHILVSKPEHIELIKLIEYDLSEALNNLTPIQYKLIFTNSDDESFDKSNTVELINELNSTSTLDNYIIGNFNKNAVRLIKEVAINGKSSYNPIFIYSKTGLGKTHLLNACANSFNQNFPHLKLRYVNTQTFIREVHNAMSMRFVDSKIIENLKNVYSSYDVLIMDDIQYLADKDKTNEILFTIFNNLMIQKKIVIMSSDKAPNQLCGFEDRMISRFSSGISCRINDPEEISIKEIINYLLKEKNLILTEDAILTIVNVFNKDIRALIGFMNKIIFFNTMDDSTNEVILDKSTIKEILEIDNFVIGSNKKINTTHPNIIIEKVAKIYNVKTSDLVNSTRKKNIVIARHVCMYIMREHYKYQLKEIGQSLGNRDHTTVLNGVEKIKTQLLTDKNFNNLIDDIIKKIN